nr:unnamed protein product [Digitaria exilis]CAB3501322.1 unnamed protein product [Digitaria exilis]
MAQPDEAQAPLLQTAEEADGEWSSRPRRIALFVEPSPFASVSASSSQALSSDASLIGIDQIELLGSRLHLGVQEPVPELHQASTRDGR